MSIQPVYDARQLTRRLMKMAMAVGRKRHYRVDEIVPRHFLQTAKASGMGESIVLQIFEELRNDSAQAIDAVQSSLPKAFPSKLANSIIRGFSTRLHQLDQVPA